MAVMDAADFPIAALLPRIRASLREHPRLMLCKCRQAPDNLELDGMDRAR
jgi:hypothetical protein